MTRERDPVDPVVCIVARPQLVARSYSRWFDGLSDVRVVAWSGLAQQLVEIAKTNGHRPVVTLIRLEGSDVRLGSLALLAGCMPTVRVAAIVPSCEPRLVGALRNAGMAGIIHDDSGKADLKAAALQLAAGHCCLCESAQTALMEMGAPAYRDLTSRIKRLAEGERRVLLLANHGLKRNEIAECLVLGVNTIDTYKGRLKEKLDLGSSEELAHFSETLEPTDE